jgi:predicted metal-dependent phosphoesterase TrpH
MNQPVVLKVEFHCHTCYSKDSLVTIQSLLKACHKKGIQRLVITDHNTIQGALRARELDPELVIIGEEVMTQEGELLTAFVKDEVPAGLPALKAIELLRLQDAFISVSHPFDALRAGHWQPGALLQILPLVDAIEVFNARCMSTRFNTQAKVFAQQHGLPGTVGSDAHSVYELGAATLSLPFFEDTDSLKKALLSVEPHTRLSAPWVHLFSRYAAWRKTF